MTKYEALELIDVWKKENIWRSTGTRVLGDVTKESDTIPTESVLLTFSIDDLDRGWSKRALVSAAQSLGWKPDEVPYDASSLYRQRIQFQRRFMDAYCRVCLSETPLQEATVQVVDVSEFDLSLGIFDVTVDGDDQQFRLCRYGFDVWNSNFNELTNAVAAKKDVLIRYFEALGYRFIVECSSTRVQ